MYDWETLLQRFELLENFSGEISVILNRLIVCVAIFVIVYVVYILFSAIRPWKTIKGVNYTIRVEYGDLLKKHNCIRIIAFDECYTTTVGNKPQDIKSDSICGQYISTNSTIDVPKLIADAGIVPEQTGSEFEGRTRYKSGTLVPNGDDLLLAFVPLNENGNGEFHSYQEYLDCLNYLWEQIDKYYSHKGVCIPVLGSSGFSRMPDILLINRNYWI